MTRRALAVCIALALGIAGCTTSSAPGSTRSPSPRPPSPPPPSPPPASSPVVSTTQPTSAGRGVDGATAGPAVPRFAHIVVAVEENKPYGRIIGNPDAPYINALARSGALLTQSFAIRHPSEPNYLALFAGSTFGVTSDACPLRLSGPNLAAQLRSRGQAFAGFSQSLPRTGYAGCSSGPYARKHAPWVNFGNVPQTWNKPFSAFPTDYSRLPRVSFVIPNLDNDMHDGTIAQGDTWLRARLAGYVSWARTHNSLFVLTFDEDDVSAGNHIATVFAGAHVRTTRLSTRVDHYKVLRTIEAACGLGGVGAAASRQPILAIWK